MLTEVAKTVVPKDSNMERWDDDVTHSGPFQILHDEAGGCRAYPHRPVTRQRLQKSMWPP